MYQWVIQSNFIAPRLSAHRYVHDILVVGGRQNHITRVHVHQ